MPFGQQQGRVWRVGFLSSRARPVSLDSEFFGGFPQAMRKLGYIEGKNLTIDWRFGDSQYERLNGVAAELVQLNVDIIGRDAGDWRGTESNFNNTDIHDFSWRSHRQRVRP